MKALRITHALKISAWLPALLMILGSGGIPAAPAVPERMLEDVQVVTNNGDIFVEVRFSSPLRYRTHFPARYGDELRIQLRAVQVPASDFDALFQRESVFPPYGDVIALDEVFYEGDSEDGPWLTIRFIRKVSYQLIPGSDYRSIRIVMRGME